MPLSAPHPCAQPGCPALVREGPRCPIHEKARNKERGTFRERGYDNRWEQTRAAHLRENPLCLPCQGEARITSANTVDHITPWQTGNGEAERQRLKYDRGNLMSMCSSCHSRKTALFDGGFGRARR